MLATRRPLSPWYCNRRAACRWRLSIVLTCKPWVAVKATERIHETRQKPMEPPRRHHLALQLIQVPLCFFDGHYPAGHPRWNDPCPFHLPVLPIPCPSPFSSCLCFFNYFHREHVLRQRCIPIRPYKVPCGTPYAARHCCLDPRSLSSARLLFILFSLFSPSESHPA